MYMRLMKEKPLPWDFREEGRKRALCFKVPIS